MVRCPLHEDRTPSLSVNLNSGLWVCFSCGEKGTVQKLARICDGELDESELAIRSAKAQASPYYEEPPDFTALANELHLRALEQRPEALVRYFAEKGLHGLALSHFRLGWDGGRISQPYFDDGTCIAIKYRFPDGFKTYEQGSRTALYNLDSVRGKPTVVVCEGESDTHAVWSELVRRGITDPAVCGVPGASKSQSQWEVWGLDLMWAKRVYVLFDADDAGDNGADRAIEVLGEKAVRVRPVRGNDAAEHLLKGGSLEEAGLEVGDLLAGVAS